MSLKKAEIIGAGNHAIVYSDKENPNLAIVEKQDKRKKKNFRQVKGQYYLTKILNLLFPRNLADIHLAGKSTVQGKNYIVMDRVEHDQEHENIQKNEILNRTGKWADEQTRKNARESATKMEKRDRDDVRLLREEMLLLGITFDTGIQNFTRDRENNLIILSNEFVPWDLDRHNKIAELNFNNTQLVQAIELMPNFEKEKAMRYYIRLMELYKEDKNSLRRKT